MNARHHKRGVCAVPVAVVVDAAAAVTEVAADAGVVPAADNDVPIRLLVRMILVWRQRTRSDLEDQNQTCTRAIVVGIRIGKKK